ncbi:MAG: ABC transporter substrate-binding protein [Chthoniobacterales bacterium]
MLNLNRAFCSSFAVVLLAAGLAACHDNTHHGRVVIRYWEKWTGFEADAMKHIVDDFNKSQDRIWVDYSSVSQIDRKLMLATAGGVPPDVAGMCGDRLPVYAENNALMPLDKLAREAGIKKEDYIDSVWRIGVYKGHLFGLPSTPGSVGLIWNKKLFREAGLDPERPPRSIKELEEFNEKLTSFHPDGSVIKMGHHPQEPGWWAPLFGYWFGAKMWDGKDRITANTPEQIAAFKWIESYPRRFGRENIRMMKDGFGAMASSQNPFLSGRVAMEMQGVWIDQFIKNYAPKDFEWGVAAFPSFDPEKLPNVALVECDLLVIPMGGKHPQEAFEFIRYVNTQGPMEKLCLAMRKFSPFKEVSADFYKNHPNSHIREFVELARSPNAMSTPQIPMWTQYTGDMNNGVTRIIAGTASPQEVLNDIQERDQQVFAKRQARWKLIEPKILEQWSKYQ